MRHRNTGRKNRQRFIRAILACVLAFGLMGQSPDDQEPSEERRMIPWSQAHEHIGEEVTIEGRIVATHASPLSTLLSFDQSFNKFTAVIRPADRDAFPPEPEKYYRGRRVRVSGRVVEYEKKAEIVLKHRGQIQVLETTAPPKPAPQESDDTSELTLEVIDRLTAIEGRLDGIANQLELILAALEQPAPPESPQILPLPGRIPTIEPPPRPRSQLLRSLKRGMNTSQVRKLVGTPAYVDPMSEGGEVWYYGGGRTITFDHRGRLEATAGFQRHR